MRSRVAPLVLVTGLFAFAVPAVASAQGVTAAGDAYGGPVVPVAPVIQEAPPSAPPAPPAPLVLPAEEEVEAPEVTPEEQAPEAARPPADVAEEPAPKVAALPFTGFELGAVSVLGLALLGAGIAGRVLMRRGVGSS